MEVSSVLLLTTCLARAARTVQQEEMTEEELHRLLVEKDFAAAVHYVVSVCCFCNTLPLAEDLNFHSPLVNRQCSSTF